MFNSAEIRWFWENMPAPTLHDWFLSSQVHGCPAGGGDDDPRPDLYLRDADQQELGIKARSGKTVEVKGLVSVVWSGSLIEPFTGPIEIWTKWSAPALKLDPSLTIETKKARWLRKFDTSGTKPREMPLNEKEQPVDEKTKLPDLGCNVELTRVSVGSAVWWTFAFEAFGKPTTIIDDLRAVTRVLAERKPPPIGNGMMASYPAWLQASLKSPVVK